METMSAVSLPPATAFRASEDGLPLPTSSTRPTCARGKPRQAETVILTETCRQFSTIFNSEPVPKIAPRLWRRFSLPCRHENDAESGDFTMTTSTIKESRPKFLGEKKREEKVMMLVFKENFFYTFSNMGSSFFLKKIFLSLYSVSL